MNARILILLLLCLEYVSTASIWSRWTTSATREVTVTARAPASSASSAAVTGVTLDSTTVSALCSIAAVVAAVVVMAVVIIVYMVICRYSSLRALQFGTALPVGKHFVIRRRLLQTSHSHRLSNSSHITNSNSSRLQTHSQSPMEAAVLEAAIRAEEADEQKSVLPHTPMLLVPSSSIGPKRQCQCGTLNASLLQSIAEVEELQQSTESLNVGGSIGSYENFTG